MTVLGDGSHKIIGFWLHLLERWRSLSRKIDNIYKNCNYFSQDYFPEIVFGHL